MNTTDGLQHLASLSANDQQESLQDEQALAEAILAIVFDKRRLLPGETDKPVDFADEAAFHLQKIRRAIDRREPIPMVLPAFPAKSPNRDKTLSHLPDLGDKLALRSLHEMCERIRAIYEPGAELLICSDGRVFADLVRIPDEHVTEYGKLLREHAREELGETVSFLDLDDIFEGMDDFDSLREELLIGFGESLHDLRIRIKQDPAALAMYCGITRFLFEDFLGLPEFEGMSRRAVQKQARRYAYRVIQRSNAWSRLIAKYHAHALRLSIHPQPRVSEKIGVIMIPSDDVWRTPWHSVAVETEQGFRLMPRHEAEKLSSSLVFVDGRASHYRDASAALAA